MEPFTSSQYYRHAVALLFIVPALGGFLFGYDIGATSFAIVQLMDKSPQSVLSGASFSLANAPVWTGLVVSASSVGALLGTSIVFVAAEAMGRRLELRFGGLLFCLGTLLEVASARIAIGWLALTVLIVARILYGTGIGFSMHAAPAYLAEVMPPSIRGAVVSGKEVAIVGGMLLGYATGYAFQKEYRGWTHTYAVTLIFSSIMVVLSYYIPDSPRWLVSHGRDEEAMKALMFVWNPEKAKEEHEAMVKARQSRSDANDGDNQLDVLGNGKSHKKNSVMALFSVPAYRSAMTAGVGLVVLQQITGQPSVLSYATPILMSAGLSSYASVVVAFFKVVATLVAVVLVEHSGRRKLLIAGCTLMLIALMILTVTFHHSDFSTNHDGSDDNAKHYSELDARSLFALIGMFVYIAGYQVRYESYVIVGVPL
jgi:MFS family permease